MPDRDCTVDCPGQNPCPHGISDKVGHAGSTDCDYPGCFKPLPHSHDRPHPKRDPAPPPVNMPAYCRHHVQIEMCEHCTPRRTPGDARAGFRFVADPNSPLPIASQMLLALEDIADHIPGCTFNEPGTEAIVAAAHRIAAYAVKAGLWRRP